MFKVRNIAQNILLRAVRLEDAPALAASYRRNREHLRPWEPARSEEFFTEQHQRQDIARQLLAAQAGEGLPLVLTSDDRIVGRFNLSGVIRGPFQSAGLGYWIDRDHLGNGLASEAVRAIVEECRDTLELHRLEASTLVRNVASQRVLLRNGFQQIGMAPRYLQIAGEWQDHNLYQVILHDETPWRFDATLA